MKSALVPGSRYGWRGALILPAEYFDTAPPVSGGLLKYWSGSAWVGKPVKYWNGSAWVAGAMKWWDGADWQLSGP